VSAALGVGAGAWVVAEAAKNDNVERIVGSTVNATIEPVSVGASAAGRGVMQRPGPLTCDRGCKRACLC
jgi:hypothetical protein